MRTFALYRSVGFIGVRIGCVYLAAKSSEHRAYFSERNRIRTHVLSLPRGWRLVLRVNSWP